MRRVFPRPEHDNVSMEMLQAMYTGPRTSRSDGRPVVEVCMITTPDGAISVDGRSGPLGHPTDSRILATLRHASDLVLVGAGTVRAENYGAPSRGGLRIGVVSRSGHVDTSSALFTSGAGFLIVPASAKTPAVDHIVCGDTTVDFTALLPMLRTQFSATFLHVEGGPQINAELFGIDAVDVVNLTIAPWVSGGTGEGISTHTALHSFTLEHICIDDSHVFARYVRAPR